MAEEDKPNFFVKFLDKLRPSKAEEEKKDDVIKLPGSYKSVQSNTLIIQQMSASAESHYFWILNMLRDKVPLGYEVEKVSDIFTATEASSYFGNIETRKAAQQDRVAQYLTAVGGLTKNLFQMVRELRLIDERMQYYKDSKKDDESARAAEITLKDMWTTLVEGGVENPASVTGLSQKVTFITLPDLFYSVNPKDGSKGVDKEVDKLEGFNERVKNTLRKKLKQYYAWKENTEKEFTVRRNFILKALNQTYHTIKMYSTWLKPYLRHIRNLEMGNISSPDLVTSFETNQVELELIATKKNYSLKTQLGVVEREYTHLVPVIQVKFKFVTIPEMAFQKEFQHKGAVHGGRTTMEMRGYVMKKEDFEKYKKQKENEDFEILKSIDESVEAIGDELKKYIEEAQGPKPEPVKKEEKLKAKDIFEPFTSIFDGFKDLFSGFKIETSSKEKMESRKEDEEQVAKGSVGSDVFVLYDVYKKAHGMLSW